MSKNDDIVVEFSIQWRPRNGEWEEGVPYRTYGSRQEIAELLYEHEHSEDARYTEWRAMKRHISPWKPTKIVGKPTAITEADLKKFRDAGDRFMRE